VIIRNTNRDSVLGEAIEVAETSAKRAKGLLGRDSLAAGEGLLFKRCSSLHTFFMRFAIDIAYIDKDGRVLKMAHAVPPFRVSIAPFRAHYALELPAGSLVKSGTKVKDVLRFVEEYEIEEEPEPLKAAA
jgi:uncharacterized membrane protein (UPF0127 family)